MSATAATPTKTQELPFLPFHRAMIEAPEIDAVLEVLRSGWLTTGPRVKQFETDFAASIGASHAVALSSCTAALHLALEAIGLQRGHEVILPTMTFASCGEVILYFGAKPVLVDCEADSFHMDAHAIEGAMTPRTKAILPVHYSGYARNLDMILAIASARGLRVIEDAAHAFPSRYKGRTIGTLGDITCFSFYATKTMTTGEGGMVTTENPEYADRIRMLSLHGISRDAWKRYSSEGTWRYDIEATGYKYNLTDLQAALGIAQLRKAEFMRARRAALAARYTTELSGFDAFVTPSAPVDVEHAWHLYVLQVNEKALAINRDRVVEELKSRGIGSSVHFIPLHLHPLYREQCGYSPGQFPNAEKRFASAFSLPLFPGLTIDEQSRVIEALADIARLHRR
jgi:dTDP-4-amino-4,6-dideoxygalactose transaminase